MTDQQKPTPAPVTIEQAREGEDTHQWIARLHRENAQKAAQKTTPPDMLNQPPHYTQHPCGVECITVTEHMGFCLGNAVKYIWRADLKGGIEDLKKARWYIEREIAKREAANA